MKNDLTTTFLNCLLAFLVLACVALAVLNMSRTRDFNSLQNQLLIYQGFSQHAQQLANDVISYNASAKSPELNQILQTAMAPQPQQPAK